MLQFEATHVIRCGRYVALCIIRCSWKSSRCASTARVFTQGYSLVSSPALPTLQDMPSLMPAYPCTDVATSCRITIVESQARAVRARPVIVQTPSGAAAAVLFQRRGCMTVENTKDVCVYQLIVCPVLARAAQHQPGNVGRLQHGRPFQDAVISKSKDISASELWVTQRAGVSISLCW